MTLATDPEQVCKIVLAADEGKPEPRPTFLYHYLTAREMRKHRSFCRELMAAEDEADMPTDTEDEIFGHLRSKLIGWENMGREFNPDELDDVITLVEAFELLFRLAGQKPEAVDIKKYKSLSDSSTDDTAKSAPVATDVKTDPTPTPPLISTVLSAEDMDAKSVDTGDVGS